MNHRSWLRDYYDTYLSFLKDETVWENLEKIKILLIKTIKNRGKIIIAGNGGSASIASHFSIDITKNAKLKCINFNEAGLITCFANDYGYEHWIEKAIEFYSKPQDIVILISSSGKSKNIINGAKFAKKIGNKVITLTGFEIGNPLSQIGDINLWVNSSAYNIVENIHQIWLLTVVDLIIGKSKYSAN